MVAQSPEYAKLEARHIIMSRKSAARKRTIRALQASGVGYLRMAVDLSTQNSVMRSEIARLTHANEHYKSILRLNWWERWCARQMIYAQSWFAVMANERSELHNRTSPKISSATSDVAGEVPNVLPPQEET